MRIAKRSELYTFKVLPKRWGVGRRFSGRRTREGFGISANASSTLVFNSCISRSLRCCSEDREQKFATILHFKPMLFAVVLIGKPNQMAGQSRFNGVLNFIQTLPSVVHDLSIQPTFLVIFSAFIRAMQMALLPLCGALQARNSLLCLALRTSHWFPINSASRANTSASSSVRHLW